MTAVRYQLQSADGSKSVEISEILIAGRNPDCDLVLTEGNPSRRHAQVSVRADGVWIEDLGSTNGTFVNRQEVSEAVRINHGDRIAFDTEEFVFLCESVSPADDPNATVLVRRDPAAMGPGATAPGATAPGATPPCSEGAAPPSGEAPSEPPAPPSPTAEPGPAPEPEIVPGQSAGVHRPGSWADPEYQRAQGTRLFNPEELQQLGAGAAAASAGAETLVEMPYLQVATGSDAGRGLELEPGQQANLWSIGSDDGRDIVLKDDGISGFHAKIVNEGARWRLIDQMSANGTFVNGQRSNISYLKDGDRIRFGPVECVFRLPRGAKRLERDRRRTLLIAALSFAVTVAVLAALLAYLL